LNRKMFLTSLALVALQSGEALAQRDYEFLRVSVQCPILPGNGQLIAVDQNRAGEQSRLVLIFQAGELTRVATETALPGQPPREYFSLSRSTAMSSNTDLPLFKAFEHGAIELKKYYCDADAASRKRLEDLMSAQRDLLNEGRAK